jgi:solute:Na+ symporter, SSS family
LDIRLIIVVAYLLLMLGIGLACRRKASLSGVEFYLAGRSLPPALLYVAIASTNFSAFTIFGLSGAGYRTGFAFYPLMAFGTGFMALALFAIGTRIRALGAARGYVTPSDFILDRYGSVALARTFSAVMIAFTLPYIAIQSAAAGKSLEALTGLPYFAGASLVTGFVIIYVALGGLRSVAWTDVPQGAMILAFTAAAFVLVAAKSGGFVRAHEAAYASFPGLFSRPGLDGSIGPGVWLGYLVLWLAADPMFPQLFQKSLAARSGLGLKATAVLYPITAAVLFFMTVSIGVLGRLTFPDLPMGSSDSILPLLLGRFASPAIATLLLTAGLAALMSTMDSQLLALSSMVALDFGPSRERPAGVGRHRAVAAAIGLAGLAIATRPPRTILEFANATSFGALAMLAPTVVGGLFWKRATKEGAFASIALGETFMLLSGLGLVRFPGTLPVLPALLLGTAAFVAASLATDGGKGRPELARAPGAATRRAALPFCLLFLAANDYWAWGREPILVFGLPLWLLYSAALCVALSLAYAVLLPRRAR